MRKDSKLSRMLHVLLHMAREKTIHIRTDCSNARHQSCCD